MKRTTEFVVGLIGSILGIINGIFVLSLGALGTVLKTNVIKGSIILGLCAILFSILGIIGVYKVKNEVKFGGWLMTIAAVGGMISISIFYILPGILLIVAGLIALIKKNQSIIITKEIKL